MLHDHAARWTAAIDKIATHPVFRRGFIDEVQVDPWIFPNVGEWLLRDAPVLRGVRFAGITEDGMTDEAGAAARVLATWQQVITCPAFRLLRGVGFGVLGYDCRVFGEVTPGWESVGGEALIALLATDTSRLDALDVRHAKSHKPLYADPLLQQLARLEIWLHNINDSQALFAALTGSRVRSLAVSGDLGTLKEPVLAMLTELRIESLALELDWVPAKLERFAFATKTIRDEPVERAIVCARNVRELHLDGGQVPGWRRLARAELPQLRVLRVYGDDIGATEAEKILRMPCAAQLEVLQLKQIDDAARDRLERRFGVLVEAIELRPCVYWR